MSIPMISIASIASTTFLKAIVLNFPSTKLLKAIVLNMLLDILADILETPLVADIYGGLCAKRLCDEEGCKQVRIPCKRN